jgi:hypothetical protein
MLSGRPLTSGISNAERLILAAPKKELPREAIGNGDQRRGLTHPRPATHSYRLYSPGCAQCARARMAEVTSKWADLPVNLAGHVYRARWIDGSEPDLDPFARALGTPMRDETLAAIGARRRDGSI